MSRIIKFMAWDDVAKKMYYSQQEQFDDMLGFRFSHFETENPIYMQFIGYTDKHKIEIYEFDIVKCPLGRDSNSYLWMESMKQGHEGYVIRLITIPEIYQEGLPDDCEILGNKFTHKHLLEAQG